MYCLGECLLEDKMQVCRKSWVRKLGCPIIVVNKVDAARGCVSDLPAWRQWTKLLTVYVAQVSEEAYMNNRHQCVRYACNTIDME